MLEHPEPYLIQILDLEYLRVLFVYFYYHILTLITSALSTTENKILIKIINLIVLRTMSETQNQIKKFFL